MSGVTFKPKLCIEVIHRDNKGKIIEHYKQHEDGRREDYGNTGE